MPTHDVLAKCWRDWARLTPEEHAAFLVAVDELVEDLRARGGLRAGLRVKGVRGAPGVYELTWASDGRATFFYGRSIVGDEPHMIWRRVGTHEILRDP